MGKVSALAAAQSEDFRLVMRQLAAGVSVVTAALGLDRGGFTATSVISLSVSPPRLLISVDKRSSTLPFITQSGAFSVSFLAAHQQNIAEVFAGQADLNGSERFSVGDWRKLPGNGNELVGALANVNCVVEEQIERHDHVLVIGEVVWSSSGDGPPLVHWQRTFSQIGLRAVS